MKKIYMRISSSYLHRIPNHLFSCFTDIISFQICKQHTYLFPMFISTRSAFKYMNMGHTQLNSCQKSNYSSKVHSFYNNHILDQYAAKETQRVTLRQLTVFGKSLTHDKILRSANYLRNELPVRLAHRIRDFQNLPFIVGTNPHIEMVYHLYWDAFEQLRNVPVIGNLDDNDAFCELTDKMLDTHLSAIPQLAMGIAETSGQMASGETNRFMNEMLRSRIGRRVLAEQHLALTEAFMDGNHHDEQHLKNVHSFTYKNEKEEIWKMKNKGMIGIVDMNCHAGETIKRCQMIANELFEQLYGCSPPTLIVDGHTETTFTYIPDHLEYILFEIIKNSLYHTMVQHAPHLLVNPVEQETLHSKAELEKKNDLNRKSGQSFMLPAVKVTVSQNDHQVMFRISDQGGGIPREVYEHLWSFSHISKQKLMNFNKMPHMAAKLKEKVPPTLHLGLGLCMSKAFANYWGGSIQVHSMEGYGTDVYLKISTGNQEEHLKYSPSAFPDEHYY